MCQCMTNNNTIMKHRFVVVFVDIRQCIYVTFYIKHHVAQPLIITAPRMRLVQSTWIRPTTNVSERRRAGLATLGTDVEPPSWFLEIHCRRGGRSRVRKYHLTRSLVASEGWSLVRDRTYRKHCPLHKIWSYKRDGRWWGWSFDRGSTVLANSAHPQFNNNTKSHFPHPQSHSSHLRWPIPSRSSPVRFC